MQAGSKIAVIGAMAKAIRYQGAGSSHVNPLKLDQPVDFLPGAAYAPGCDNRGDTTDALIAEAVRTAKNAPTAVVFAGLPDRYESEGFDRDDMKMPPGHIRMIEAVAGANPNTVVVLLCGSPVAAMLFRSRIFPYRSLFPVMRCRSRHGRKTAGTRPVGANRTRRTGRPCWEKPICHRC